MCSQGAFVQKKIFLGTDTEIESFKNAPQCNTAHPLVHKPYWFEKYATQSHSAPGEDINIKSTGKWSLQFLVPHQLMLDLALPCDSTRAAQKGAESIQISGRCC